MKRAVVDASVILKWYLLDEAHGTQALALLQQCTAGELEILAPSLLTYELMNGLMIAMTKRIGLSVGWVRNIMEFFVLAAGFFMGGSVGFGTLFMAILFGRFVQITFKLFKFDIRQVVHRTIDQDFALLFNQLKH